MESRKLTRTEDIPSSSTPTPPSVTPKAQLPLVRPNEAALPEPTPVRVDPEPADTQSPVVNSLSSPEREVVPPSPPLIIIFDASSDEAAAPPDSPAGETVDLPTSPVGGISDLFGSSSGEVVALTDSPAVTISDDEDINGIADVGDNQVPDAPDYRHFLDQQQQSDSHDNELYVGQGFCQLEDLKHAVKIWHIKSHVTFKAKRCVKDTWVLCYPAEGCQWKLRASKRKNLKVCEIIMIEGPHTCVMPTISQDHNKMDSKLVGKNILAMVEENE
ncbi:hypothetical protein JHK86_012317 [Glycine max]|nr:hypothetical protein JHK86_012317 [Glycine max]